MNHQYDQVNAVNCCGKGSPTALLLLGEEAATGRTDCFATLNAVSRGKVLLLPCNCCDWVIAQFHAFVLPFGLNE